MKRVTKLATNSHVSVVIVDDHPMVREHLALALEAEPRLRVVGFADSRTTALEIIERLRPQLAIVDLSLRESHGLDLIKDVSRLHPDVRVLVLSMHEEAVYAQRSLEAGARGYITKQEATEKILSAVRKVLDGEVYLSPDMAHELAAGMSHSKRGTGSPVSGLSDRELQVFEMIGRGLSMGQIAAQVNLSLKTVETYRDRLKTKLQLQTPNDLRQAAIQWVSRGDLKPLRKPKDS